MNENSENTGEGDQEENEEKYHELNTGKIPMSALHALNQFCVGGFLIFYLNSETGEPEFSLTFDSAPDALAIQYYVKNFSKALDKLHLHNIRASLINDLTDGGGEHDHDIDDEDL